MVVNVGVMLYEQNTDQGAWERSDKECISM
jgi:hypothetical protein